MTDFGRDLENLNLDNQNLKYLKLEYANLEYQIHEKRNFDLVIWILTSGSITNLNPNKKFLIGQNLERSKSRNVDITTDKISNIRRKIKKDRVNILLQKAEVLFRLYERFNI